MPLIHGLLERAYLGYQETFERTFLKLQANRIDGSLRLDDAVHRTFVDAPWDMLPEFQGPVRPRRRLGRGMDHPRYGRFIYALGRVYKPQLVVELGTYAGGTAIGWAAALAENGSGRLICVDNDSYCKGTYPEITRINLAKTKLDPSRYELRNGDSRVLIPQMAKELRGQVDIYLVDADHTYEGALADIENGLPMVRKGGFILVHDVDRHFRLVEETPQHPHPVYEAMMKVINEHRLQWSVLKFIRRHLGVIRV